MAGSESSTAVAPVAGVGFEMGGSGSSSEEISITSGITAGGRERGLGFSFLFLGCFFVTVLDDSASEDEEPGKTVIDAVVTVRYCERGGLDVGNG